MGHIKTGRVRALAVTTAQRSPLVPDIPTIAESGLPGFETVAWFGLFARPARRERSSSASAKRWRRSSSSRRSASASPRWRRAGGQHARRVRDDREERHRQVEAGREDREHHGGLIAVVCRIDARSAGRSVSVAPDGSQRKRSDRDQPDNRTRQEQPGDAFTERVDQCGRERDREDRDQEAQAVLEGERAADEVGRARRAESVENWAESATTATPQNSSNASMAAAGKPVANG